MANDPQLRRAIGDPETPDPNKMHPQQRPHNSDSAAKLLDVYLEKRIAGQRQFYKARIREFDGNSGLMITVGAAIMAISAVLSAAGATVQSPEIAFVTAILPAFAALVASFRSLYQWERQSALYRDAMLGLEEAQLLMPDRDIYDAKQAAAILPTLVRTTEQVFEAEINQWGQIAMQKDSDQQQDDLNRALQDLADTERLDIGGGGDFNEGAVG